jgi:hypothetical protein
MIHANLALSPVDEQRLIENYGYLGDNALYDIPGHLVSYEGTFEAHHILVFAPPGLVGNTSLTGRLMSFYTHYPNPDLNLRSINGSAFIADIAETEDEKNESISARCFGRLEGTFLVKIQGSHLPVFFTPKNVPSKWSFNTEIEIDSPRLSTIRWYTKAALREIACLAGTISHGTLKTPVVPPANGERPAVDATQ